MARIKAASVQRDISLGLLNAVKETGDGILYFYSEGDILTKLPRKTIQEFVVQEIFHILHSAFYAYIYTFPTERTAFITLPVQRKKVRIEELLTDTKQSEFEQRGTFLVEPVKNFFDLILRSYQKERRQHREEEINKNPQLGEYVKLADFLEKEILQGTVGFETSQLQKKLLF